MARATSARCFAIDHNTVHHALEQHVPCTNLWLRNA